MHKIHNTHTRTWYKTHTRGDIQHKRNTLAHESGTTIVVQVVVVLFVSLLLVLVSVLLSLLFAAAVKLYCTRERIHFTAFSSVGAGQDSGTITNHMAYTVYHR